MRVLHVTSSFPRSPGDSQAPYLADLVGALSDAGQDVAVLSPHGPGLPVDDLIGGVQVHRFRYAPARGEVLAYRGGLMGTAATPAGAAALPGFLASFAAAVSSAVRRFRPDVVHAHWWLPAGLAAVSAARGVPVVVTCHGSDVHLAGRRPAGAIARRVLRRATLAAAVSGPLAGEVAALSGRDDILVLRMPVVAGRRPPLPQPPAPPLRLLAAGRLSPEKGFDVAVVAVSRLAAAGLDVTLDLYGDGPRRQDLEEAAAAGGAVVVHPALPRDRLWAAMDGAHAVVVPSRREGLGLVAVEALARHRPVVASAVGGLTDAVHPPADGILVPPDDETALAAALSRLPLSVPEGRAVADHDPERVVAAHLAAYHQAVHR